jgi:transposase-like protein
VGASGGRWGAIFSAPSLKEAKKRLEAFKAGLGQELPEAAACVEAGFAAATQFYALPQAHWRRLRSTNGLERLNLEFKRRIRAVGAFPDRKSALHLITAVALETTATWGRREYLNMKLLQSEEEKPQAKAV